MDNSFTTKGTKDTEMNETKVSLQRDQKPIWFAPLGFLILALSLSSIFGFVRKFPDDLFIANWLAWFIAGFFATGWLLSHWLEKVAFQKERSSAISLLLIVILGSMFFCVYFEKFINHPILSQFGLASAYLVMSGFSLRMALFRDESFLFLLQQRDKLFRR